jgi:hypothetical protein
LLPLNITVVATSLALIALIVVSTTDEPVSVSETHVSAKSTDELSGNSLKL